MIMSDNSKGKQTASCLKRKHKSEVHEIPVPHANTRTQIQTWLPTDCIKTPSAGSVQRYKWEFSANSPVLHQHKLDFTAAKHSHINTTTLSEKERKTHENWKWQKTERLRKPSDPCYYCILIFSWCWICVFNFTLGSRVNFLLSVFKNVGFSFYI